MSEYASATPSCSVCKDEGFVGLSGLTPESKALAIELGESFVLENEGLISTMYRCAFCNAADTRLAL